jgi:hypothetical protein
MSRKRKRKATPNEVWWQQKTRESMQGQLEAFRKKFGRDPRKGEPLIFDPDADEPVPYPAKKMEAELAEAFRKAGVPPQIIYAFKKTGLLIMDGIETIRSRGVRGRGARVLRDGAQGEGAADMTAIELERIPCR